MRTESSAAPMPPVSTLRGASVDIDVRRAGRAVAGLCLAALAATAVLLFVAGLQKNAQITRLHQQGVAMDVKVSVCMGLLGGSGTNSAGYRCKATFMLDGRRYEDALPGYGLYAPGATLRAIVVPGDPSLLSTPRALAGEHSSLRVFLVPAALLVIVALLVAAMAVKRGTRRRASARTQLAGAA